jgi:hypothetical protein
MKEKRNTLVFEGKEFITEKDNWLRWDITKRYYIGQSLWKYRNFLKYKLIPYSIYKQEIEI